LLPLLPLLPSANTDTPVCNAQVRVRAATVPTIACFRNLFFIFFNIYVHSS
jgi:hypothetical protein